MTSVDDKLVHLLSLRPNNGPTDPEKCLALARSFLVLETQWAAALGAADEYPCIDIAGYLGQADLAPRIQLALNESYFAQSTAEACACRNYLRWCSLMEIDSGIPSKYGLEDPFEPLLLLFEEGAEFSLEGLMFDVHKCGGINVRGLRRRILSNG